MKKDLEYTKMACFYDELYKNKNYKREVGFIEKFLNSKEDKILDAGCGTGNHAKILQDKGYNVCGFDLSPQMVEIANRKVNNNFEVIRTLSDEYELENSNPVPIASLWYKKEGKYGFILSNITIPPIFTNIKFSNLFSLPCFINDFSDLFFYLASLRYFC